MQYTGEVLLVIVFKVGVVILGSQVFSQFVISAGEGELVAFLVGTRYRQAGTVAGTAASGMLKLAGGKGQIIEFVAGDLTAFKGLRQQSTIVRHQNRQLWLQGAVAQLGLGEPHLCR